MEQLLHMLGTCVGWHPDLLATAAISSRRSSPSCGASAGPAPSGRACASSCSLGKGWSKLPPAGTASSARARFLPLAMCAVACTAGKQESLQGQPAPGVLVAVARTGQLELCTDVIDA